MKFKTEDNLPKGTKEVLEITGMSLGMGMVGDALGGATGTQLSSAGTTGAGFIKPVVNISMGGKIIGMLKDIGKEK